MRFEHACDFVDESLGVADDFLGRPTQASRDAGSSREDRGGEFVCDGDRDDRRGVRGGAAVWVFISGVRDAAQPLKWLEGERETPLAVRRSGRKLNLTKNGSGGLEVLPPQAPALYVESGSAADRAGLRTGDRLVQLWFSQISKLLIN